MSDMPAAPAAADRARPLHMVILLVLCVAAFNPLFDRLFHWAPSGVLLETVRDAMWNPEAAHAWGVPIVLLLLYVLRRRAIAAAMGRGSVWGLVLILLALLAYFASCWPFNYGLSRRLAIVPGLGGVVLAVGGWRALARSVPLLALFALAIPPGTRYYASLIIRPETATLHAARATLDLLPGVLVDLKGLDLLYTRGAVDGAIGLGLSNRGASLFVAYLVIGLFVVFARIRPFWQVVTAVVLAGPIVLFCNYARVVMLGLITIYALPDPTSQAPRAAATVFSMLLCYALVGGLMWVLGHVVEER